MYTGKSQCIHRYCVGDTYIFVMVTVAIHYGNKEIARGSSGS